MTLPSVTASDIRIALLRRDEIALLDVRHEAAFATGHPLFAANMAADRIALEAETRLPRKDVHIVVYDAGEGLGGDRSPAGVGLHRRSRARWRARGLAGGGL
jgi:rhodanese-related sulfurtransferase